MKREVNDAPFNEVFDTINADAVYETLKYDQHTKLVRYDNR